MAQEQCLEARIASAIETLIAYGPKVEAGTATTTERKEWREAREVYDAHQIYRQGMRRRSPIAATHDYVSSALDDIWELAKVMMVITLLIVIVVAFWGVLFVAIQGLAQVARL